LDAADQVEGALSHMESLPKGQPLRSLRRASTGALERVQPAGVDELECGQVEDETHRAACLSIQLTLEQSSGGAIEAAAEPEDHDARAALGADGKCSTLTDTLSFACIHAPSVGPIHETVTRG
jgi:hypothetical protein